MDDGEHPLQFSQVFQLVPENGTYYVYVLYPPLASHGDTDKKGQAERYLPSESGLISAGSRIFLVFVLIVTVRVPHVVPRVESVVIQK